MKSVIIFFSAVAICFGIAGCIGQQQIEPQKVVMRNENGSQVIFKDLYEINSDRIVDLGKARVFPVLLGNNENLPGDYDMRVVLISPGESSALFRLNTTQIIFVTGGGGMVKINETAYELREGIALYIPAKSQIRFINNSPHILKYISISTPSIQEMPEILDNNVVGETADSENDGLSDKELLKKSESIKGNEVTSPTLKQISPIDSEDNQFDRPMVKQSGITDPMKINPEAKGAVIESLNATEQKIMQDK